MDTMLYGFMLTIPDAMNCVEIMKSRIQESEAAENAEGEPAVRRKRKIMDFYNQPERKWEMPITYKYSGEHS